MGWDKKKIEKTNKYISLGEGVAAKSWDHPREFFKYCFFGGLLHKIILEDVAGRSWAGDHIYIHMGKI